MSWCSHSHSHLHPSLALLSTWRLLWHLGWFIDVYSYGLDLLKIEISVRYICVWHRLKQSSVRIAEVLSVSKADIVHSPRTSAKTAQVQSLKQVLPIDPERTQTQILIFKNPKIQFQTRNISDSQLGHLGWTRDAFKWQTAIVKRSRFFFSQCTSKCKTSIWTADLAGIRARSNGCSCSAACHMIEPPKFANVNQFWGLPIICVAGQGQKKPPGS